VKSFPAYLKKKIVDVKGNFIFETTLNKGSQNSNRNSNANSSEEQTEKLDPESEDLFGKSSFPHHWVF
jgi:hypothetical protein